MRALNVPWMFGERQQKTLFIQVQAGFDQAYRRIINMQVDEGLQLVIRAGFPFAVTPNVTDPQEREGSG